MKIIVYPPDWVVRTWTLAITGLDRHNDYAFSDREYHWDELDVTAWRLKGDWYYL